MMQRFIGTWNYLTYSIISGHETDLVKTDTDETGGHQRSGGGRGHLRGHGVTEVGHGIVIEVGIVNLVLIGT